jgi:hypothetical protein
VDKAVIKCETVIAVGSVTAVSWIALWKVSCGTAAVVANCVIQPAKGMAGAHSSGGLCICCACVS